MDRNRLCERIYKMCYSTNDVSVANVTHTSPKYTKNKRTAHTERIDCEKSKRKTKRAQKTATITTNLTRIDHTSTLEQLARRTVATVSLSRIRCSVAAFSIAFSVYYCIAFVEYIHRNKHFTKMRAVFVRSRTGKQTSAYRL